MLDLNRRRPDLRLYVTALEEWIIRTLAAFNVKGERRQDRIGIWVRRPDKGRDAEDKIAAIGVRIRHWITFHGVALNVDPVLEHFSGIVPCGVRQHGVTSLTELGVPVSMPEVDMVLRREFEARVRADGLGRRQNPEARLVDGWGFAQHRRRAPPRRVDRNDRPRPSPRRRQGHRRRPPRRNRRRGS